MCCWSVSLTKSRSIVLQHFHAELPQAGVAGFVARAAALPSCSPRRFKPAGLGTLSPLATRRFWSELRPGWQGRKESVEQSALNCYIYPFSLCSKVKLCLLMRFRSSVFLNWDKAGAAGAEDEQVPPPVLQICLNELWCGKSPRGKLCP